LKIAGKLIEKPTCQKRKRGRGERGVGPERKLDRGVRDRFTIAYHNIRVRLDKKREGLARHMLGLKGEWSPQVWVSTESMSNSTQPFRVEGWERHTEDAVRTGGRGRPSGGIELFTNPKCVGYTRETLGPQMDRQVMVLKTTKTFRERPIALIQRYWAGRDDKADASFFKKLRKGMNSIKKTHLLVLLGDYNARSKAWRHGQRERKDA
jgi:hypothetical protein